MNISANQESNLPVNISANQETNLPVNISANQETNLPVNISANQETNLPVNISANQETNLPVNISANQETNLPMNISANQETNLPVKLLFVNNGMHAKNLNSLMKYKHLEIVTVHTIDEISTDLISNFDCIYSPSKPIDVSKYPSSFFLFGPHFSVFPDHHLSLIQSKHSIYIQPGRWVVDLWKKYDICKDLTMVDIPFGVETDKFCEIKPIREKTKIFVYYKTRHPNELSFLEYFLQSNSIEYTLFHYNKKYKEEDYLQCLQDSVFGIWLGRHESQGFALQEALSCNVPLFVWDVRSMNQEFGYHYPDFPATAVPYWDERCGEIFYTIDELYDKFQFFLSRLDQYQPRQFVLEHLSIEVCEQKFIQLCRKEKYSENDI